MVFIAEAVETRRGEEGCSPLRALLQKPQLLCRGSFESPYGHLQIHHDAAYPHSSRVSLVGVAISALASASPAESLSPEDLSFFESRIRPLLSENCYKCHAQDSKKIKGGLLLDRKAGWVRGGDSGEVIVPGKPDESLLIMMVERDPELEAMPPKRALKPEQVADLREWIKRGAPDPRTEAIGKNALETEFNLEERKEWWSL